MTDFSILCDSNISSESVVYSKIETPISDCTKIEDLEKFVNIAISASRNLIEIDDHKSEVSVLFTDGDFIRDLNKTYRNTDKPTNVLSFPTKKVEKTMGDIILAIDVISQEAVEQKKSFKDHFIHLVVHGFLHLAGYDHVDNEDAEIMENSEIDILNKIGIRNPYV